MKKLVSVVVILGLAVCAVAVFQPGSGASERDQAARCLVVAKYMNSDIGDRLYSAASKRVQALAGDELKECVESQTGGLKPPPRVVNACLSYVRRYEEDANLRAFPDGDSSNMRTVQKWANSDYCKQLLMADEPPAPAAVTQPAPAATESMAPASAAPSEAAPAPSGWQQVQQQIASDPEGYVRGCMEHYLDSAQQLGGMSRDEALRQQPNLEGMCRQQLVDVRNCTALDPVAAERCFDAFMQNAE